MIDQDDVYVLRYSQQACLCVVDALIGLGCDSICRGGFRLKEVARFSLCNASFICSARQAGSVFTVANI